MNIRTCVILSFSALSFLLIYSFFRRWPFIPALRLSAIGEANLRPLLEAGCAMSLANLMGWILSQNNAYKLLRDSLITHTIIRKPYTSSRPETYIQYDIKLSHPKFPPINPSAFSTSILPPHTSAKVCLWIIWQPAGFHCSWPRGSLFPLPFRLHHHKRVSKSDKYFSTPLPNSPHSHISSLLSFHIIFRKLSAEHWVLLSSLITTNGLFLAPTPGSKFFSLGP